MRAYTSVSHGQMHYLSNGPGPGRSKQHCDLPPLVLLHQSPSDARMYRLLMDELAQHYRLIAPDNPGFGASDALPGGFTLAGCARAIVELLQKLDIGSCYLFGHHTGASIAVQICASHPAMVRRLALSGPTLLSEQMRADLPARATPLPLTGDGAHLRAMWERLAAREADAPPGLLLREVMAAFNAGENYSQAYAAVAAQDFAAQLRQVAVPTLVFAGTRDVLYGQLEASYRCLQQGQVSVIEGAGGLLCDRHPQQVAALLLEFFNA